MFSNKKNEDKQVNEISTIIGEETTLEGTLHIESSVRIDGKVIGEVICSGDVTVGKNGLVENKVSARNLFVAGKVKGDIQVKEKIHILETGYLDGSATMNAIVIDENGQFQGTSQMKRTKDEKNIVKIEKEVEEKTS